MHQRTKLRAGSLPCIRFMVRGFSDNTNMLIDPSCQSNGKMDGRQASIDEPRFAMTNWLALALKRAPDNSAVDLSSILKKRQAQCIYGRC